MGLEVAIRRARSEDIPAILDLQRSALLRNLSREDALQSGFLVSDFSALEYRAYLSNAAHFYVLEVGQDLAAFLLAYGSGCVTAQDPVGLEIQRRSEVAFEIIKQVCVGAHYRGRGYAHRLYAEVQEHSSAQRLYAAVVMEPRNQPSIRFHEREGFRIDFEITGADGLPRSVWRWDAQPTREEE